MALLNTYIKILTTFMEELRVLEKNIFERLVKFQELNNNHDGEIAEKNRKVVRFQEMYNNHDGEIAVQEHTKLYLERRNLLCYHIRVEEEKVVTHESLRSLLCTNERDFLTRNNGEKVKVEELQEKFKYVGL